MRASPKEKWVASAFPFSAVPLGKAQNRRSKRRFKCAEEKLRARTHTHTHAPRTNFIFYSRAFTDESLLRSSRFPPSGIRPRIFYSLVSLRRKRWFFSFFFFGGDNAWRDADFLSNRGKKKRILPPVFEEWKVSSLMDDQLWQYWFGQNTAISSFSLVYTTVTGNNFGKAIFSGSTNWTRLRLD